MMYIMKEYSLERNGIALHLDCMTLKGREPERNILLVHGVTYSSHEFDIDYKDYSLVRFLAREGYAVWRLDIAGFGQSEAVEDGFLPDSDYAAEDVRAAVDRIVQLTGRDQIDVLGWSWGTVTTGRFAARYPEHLRRLVLYAPILSGIGYTEVSEAFHHNTWENAAEDFQKTEDGAFDDSITEPVVIELFCSSCWHYDGAYSPNGGRRDICTAKDIRLFDPAGIQAPTLVICGDRDPYVNDELLVPSFEALPAHSQLEIIPGGAHSVYVEAPYYRDFQERLIRFLNTKTPFPTA